LTRNKVKFAGKVPDARNFIEDTLVGHIKRDEKRNQGKQYLFLSLNRIKISRIAKVSIYLKILSEIFLFSLFK